MRATLPMRICGMCKDPAIWELQYLDKFFLYIDIYNIKTKAPRVNARSAFSLWDFYSNMYYTLW